MKKFLRLFTALLVACTISACTSSNDEYVDTYFGPDFAPVDLYEIDMCDHNISSPELTPYYATLAEKSGSPFKPFASLEANNFYTLTIDNIPQEIKDGHLTVLNTLYPLKDWTNYKMVLVHGRFVNYLSHIESTQAYLKDNTYHIVLNYFTGQSYFCSLGHQYTSAFIFPKDRKIKFTPKHLGETTGECHHYQL